MKKNLLLLSAFLLSAVGFSQANSIQMVDASDITVEQGTTLSFDVIYTANAVYSTQFQLFSSKGTPDNIFSLGGQTGLAPQITSIQTGILTGETITVDINIPSDFPLSSSLTAPFKYWIFGKIAVPAVVTPSHPADNDDTYFNPYPVVIVVAPGTLGVKLLEKINSNEMFVNSASKSLEVNIANVKANKATVYDMTGRVVSTINNLKGASSVDLSGLNKGVYVLKADNNKSMKFAL
jgi:Secretion system C-terminal sorting domain